MRNKKKIVVSTSTIENGILVYYIICEWEIKCTKLLGALIFNSHLYVIIVRKCLMLLKYRERRKYHGDYHKCTTVLYLTLIMEKCVGIWYVYCDINDILLCIRINRWFYTRVYCLMFI